MPTSDRYNNSCTIIFISNERRAKVRLSLFWGLASERAAERLGAENLGSMYDPLSVCKQNTLKKTPSP